MSKTLIAFVVGAMAIPAIAAGPLVIGSKLLVEKRVAAADGTTATKLVPATNVVPGDRVTFVVTYRNTGAMPIADLVLANPLPRQIAFRGAADGSPAPEVSADGKTFGTLAALRVPAAGGGMRAAVPNDVTHVRWRLASPLAAGSSGERAFQAVLK